jgi:hypothetical protein
MNCELMLTCDTPASMFNVYKNQLSRQTGSRNLMGRKTLPTIWHNIIIGVRAMVFNATFNNISAISWRSLLLVEKTGEKH